MSISNFIKQCLTLTMSLHFYVKVALLLLFSGLTIEAPIARASDASLVSPSPLAQVPIENFFQHPKVLDAKLSPSGKQLALTTSRGSNRIALVVIELGEKIKVLHRTRFSDSDVVEFNWVGENRLIFSLLDLQSGGGEDEYAAPGLYAVNPDGSALLQLVKRKNDPLVSNGDSSRDRRLKWNHLLLCVPEQQTGVLPDEVVIGRMDFDAEKLESISPIWLNTRTGRTRSMLLNAPPHALGWMFDNKGEAKLVSTTHENRTAHYWRGSGEVAWRKLAESDLLKSSFTPKAIDGLGNLYVTSKEGPEGFQVLRSFDFATGAPQKEALVTTPGFDFRGNMVLNRTNLKAMGVLVETDAERTIWFDESMNNVQKLADEYLPGRINRLNCSRCGEDDMVVLVFSYSDREPGNYYFYEAATKRWQHISNIMDDIEPARMASMDFQRIKARDGRDLPVWITQPANTKAGQALPTVVLVHGGPWVRGEHWGWHAMEQFLASRGYLVISPEFRGSAGYGEAHYQAGWKQWGQTMQDDVTDALRWAQKQGLASEKACIAGASYGGYSALMGLIRDPELYRCGVSWVAVTDLFLLLKGSWFVKDDSNSQVRKYMLPELVGDAEKDAAMLTANSPLAQAKRIKAPLLLAFGGADRRVPIAHGKRLRDALIEAGRAPEWIEYSTEAHGWRQVSTQVDFARRVDQFLAKYLKDN